MDDAECIRCGACGALNRVDPQRVARGETARCGRCKAALEAAAGPVVVSDARFAELVERSPLPVLLDAWAAWCGPCRTLAPVIDGLAVELAGRVRVAKLDVDANPATATRFALRSIPTLLIFRDGREVDRLVGVQPRAEILRRLQAVMP